MQLSQSALFRLCCASFLTGILLALFYDFLYMTRLWFLPPQKRYTIQAIQKFRVANAPTKKAKKSSNLRVIIFFTDFLFCLVGGVTLILLLYWLNNGAFRAAAPLCMTIGFGIWHIAVSKAVRMALEWFAFCIETILCTLFNPIKWLCASLFKVCQKGAQKIHRNRLFKQRKNYTKKELLHIEKNVQNLLPIDLKARTQKGETRAKYRKKAV